MPNVILARRAFFSADRELRVPEWSADRNRQVFGRLANAHGYDYVLDVFYRGEPSPRDGMIANITHLKPIIADAVAVLDGKLINREVADFQACRPTVENLVDFLWRRLPARLDQGELARLRLRQTPRLWAEAIAGPSPDQDIAMRVTRTYEFAAAHRLQAPWLADEENSALYGKCNSPHGHGHNYGLEVAVEGAPDPDTGTILAPGELDRIVEQEVFEPFDHKHLNVDCPDFAELIPTSENLANVIFRRLRAGIDGAGRRLARVGLHETQKNYFEVEA